jgi:hypothetical protein
MPPPPLPKGDAALLIRSEFSDDAMWLAIVDATTRENPDGFVANLAVVDDQAWAGASVQDVITAHAGDNVRVVAFVFDAAAASDKERHALLCINLASKKVRTMRVLPTEVWSVENNLSLGNMEWRDFASVLKEGVFVGF